MFGIEKDGIDAAFVLFLSLGLVATAGCQDRDEIAGEAPAPDAPAPEAPASIDPQADELLREMCELLGSEDTFSFQADIAEDAPWGAQTIQFDRRLKVSVRRPNRLRVDVEGDLDRTVTYDGESLTLIDRRREAYVTFDAPPTLDEALDQLAEYGISVGLVEWIFSDPYGVMIENVESGSFIGPTKVGDLQCNHLAFRQPDYDWQVWIDTGESPLPRRMLLIDKLSSDRKRTVAWSIKWEFPGQIPDERFQADVPEGFVRLEPRPFATLDES